MLRVRLKEQIDKGEKKKTIKIDKINKSKKVFDRLSKFLLVLSSAQKSGNENGTLKIE